MIFLFCIILVKCFRDRYIIYLYIFVYLYTATPTTCSRRLQKPNKNAPRTSNLQLKPLAYWKIIFSKTSTLYQMIMGKYIANRINTCVIKLWMCREKRGILLVVLAFTQTLQQRSLRYFDSFVMEIKLMI